MSTYSREYQEESYNNNYITIGTINYVYSLDS